MLIDVTKDGLDHDPIDEKSENSTDEQEEERLSKLLKEEGQQSSDTNEFQEFQKLSKSKKMSKLDELVKSSQIFSNIIADTLLKAKEKPTALEEKDKDKSRPGRKKRKLGENSERYEKQQAKKAQVKETLKQESEIDKEKLRSSEGLQFHQPKLISGAVMKDYQIAGMEWLVTLYQNGLNGILADEMGLGKTLQCISMIAFLMEQGIEGPFLVVGPLSTVSNWINEFKKFAPSIKALGYVGHMPTRTKLKRIFSQYSVIVTSYEICIKDFAYFNRSYWKFLIVDEGHRLKNTNCLLIRKLRKLKASNRLLLTGTPLQNNLNELWSLLNFILPEIFHNIDMFQQWFDFSGMEKLKDDDGNEDGAINKVIDMEIQKTLVGNLHTILRPFLLRRVKKDVIKDLPPKREYIVYSKLSEKQEIFYKAILAKNFFPMFLKQSFKQYLSVNNLASKELLSDEKYLEDYVESNMIKSKWEEPIEDDRLREHFKFVYREARNKRLEIPYMQLRLICDSPYMFFFPWNDDSKLTDELIDDSCKLKMLGQLLPKLLSTNHKVIIFTQFTRMIDILQYYLQEFLDIEPYRLDGTVSAEDRAEQIQEFNSDEDAEKPKVFLITTRAGGLGINLTASDTVILFDSDWNPQVDLQAMDRIHRIGQTKPCLIYRFVTANTIEEILLSRADSKRNLEKLIIQCGHFKSLLNISKTRNPSTEAEVMENLKLFLTDKKVKAGQQLSNNTLSKLELKELLDRSDSAYENRTLDKSEYSHVSLFETITSI
ncbi:unnamed protein product [Ambrosiozyma monospora]|uniref:Unnamed protein product n=1 Tax=Ambrosiozyma monospora TaxID=43982 RepID=A0A9W6YZR7_AMBMO|nr:unnamed protein product [Ambrosiozyma monospora]